MATPVKVHTILGIPHFHFDLEWWKREEGYAQDVVAIMQKVSRLLSQHSQFTYALDQRDAILPFFKRYPKEREKFKEWIKEGRVECVGGTLSSPDENIPLGESLIRQFQLGRRWFREALDTEIKNGWQIDVFGHPAQMPQILKKCGFETYTFARGAQPPSAYYPLFFDWQAPDKTTILCWWMANHYAGFMFAFPKEKVSHKLFQRELISRLKTEGVRARSIKILPVPFGTDFMPPSEQWLSFQKKWNARQSVPLSFSTPSALFEKIQQARNKVPTIAPVLNPVFTGCYESRVKLKKRARSMQHRLLFWEKIAALAAETGYPYPYEELDRAWEGVVRNDFHDILCGTGTDKVYLSALSRYAKAQQSLQRAAHRIVRHLRENFESADSLVLLNLHNFPRQVYLEVPRGKTVQSEKGSHPLQHLQNYNLVSVSLPPFSQNDFPFVSEKEAAPISASPFHYTSAPPRLSTPFFEVVFSPVAAAIQKLFYNGQDVLQPEDRLGELLFREDGGNLWTIQETGRKRYFRDLPSRIEILERGPLRFSICFRRKCHKLHLLTTFVFYADSPVIDIRFSIQNTLQAGRLQALFPMASPKPYVTEPFYLFSPTREGQFPIQDCVAFEGKGWSCSLSTNGLPSFEIRQGSYAVTLLRSVGFYPRAFFRFLWQNRKGIRRALRKVKELQIKQCLNVGEWALYPYHGLMLREWATWGGLDLKGGMNLLDHLFPYLFPCPSLSLEQGKFTFALRLSFSASSLEESDLLQKAWGTQEPFLCFLNRTSGTEKRELPLLLPETKALLTTLKKARNGKTIVRFYHPLGKEAEVCFPEGTAPILCNMLEQEEKAVASLYRLKPWEVATFAMDHGR